MNIFKNLSTVAAGAVFISLGATDAAQAVIAGSSSGIFGTPALASSNHTVTGTET